VPAVAAESGRSTHETMPASVSKLMVPRLAEAIDVTPVVESTVNEPFSILRPPAKVEVAVVEVAVK